MRHRLTAFLAVAVLTLTISGSALAFDCIRVSSSPTGLQASTKSGNWLMFNMSSTQAVQQTFTTLLGMTPPPELASCVATAYAGYGVSPYFALGAGVAGGKKDTNRGGFGVLAWHNPNTAVLGNLRGIDHLDDSPIGAALFGSLASCGIDVSDS